MREMHIRVYGWSVAGVEGETTWAYSIGLAETFAHPELVVMDMNFKAAQQLINAVAEVVRVGNGRPDPTELQGMGVGLVDVAERHLGSDSELFNQWIDYYGELPRAGDFVQILPPPELYCSSHRDKYRRLDRP